MSCREGMLIYKYYLRPNSIVYIADFNPIAIVMLIQAHVAMHQERHILAVVPARATGWARSPTMQLMPSWLCRRVHEDNCQGD
jgi:hypothetical protein